MSDWTSRLRQASFRGVPFGVLTNDWTTGRRLGVHEYPDRDDPYVEDMGRATGRIALRGFLIEDSVVYGGGALDGQVSAMLAAVDDVEGPGLLVHPSRGPLQVNVERLTVSERWEKARYVELGFELVISGALTVFGVQAPDTVSAVLAAAATASALLTSLFGDDADSYVGGSTGSLGSVGSVTSLFSTSALGLSGGVGGVFGLGSTAASPGLTAALASFGAASSGLGVSLGAGVATANAAVQVVQALSATSDPGSAMDSAGDLADDFGDDGG